MAPSSEFALPQTGDQLMPYKSDCLVGFDSFSTNETNATQAMWSSRHVPHGQTFPDIYRIKPTPNPKAPEEGSIISTYFGRPIFNQTTKTWQTTYLVQEGGRLLVESPTENTIAQLAGPDKPKSKQARVALESISQAAGKLWVPICTCRTKDSDQLLVHQACNHHLVTMSGFWFQDNKFVTAAHFLDVRQGVQPHQKCDTTAFLRSLHDASIEKLSNGLRARVSCEVWAAREQDYDNEDDMRIFHVYLHSLDYEADLAVFRILPTEKHQPQHFVREDQLANTAAMSRHALHNPLFSVYYAGNDVPMNQYSAPDPLMQAKALNTDCKKKVCEFLARDSAEQQRLSDQDTMEIPNFEDVFLPDRRAAAMGRLICPDIIVIADEQAVTISREHTIVGYYGCSGGMIGTFHEAISNGPGPNHAQASLEVKVIGISCGGHGVNNAMKAFAPGAIKFLCG